MTRATFLPLLAPAEPERLGDGPVLDEFCGDLAVAYSFGPPFGKRLVTHNDLERLDMSRRVLRRTALEYLESVVDRAEFHGQPPALMLSFDGLESTLLLSDRFWERLHRAVPGDLVVGVPARDVVIVTGSESRPGLEKARRAVDRVFFAGDENLLTRRLLVRRGGLWEPFDRAPAAAGRPAPHGGGDQRPRQFQEHPSWPGERVPISAMPVSPVDRTPPGRPRVSPQLNPAARAARSAMHGQRAAGPSRPPMPGQGPMTGAIPVSGPAAAPVSGPASSPPAQWAMPRQRAGSTPASPIIPPQEAPRPLSSPLPSAARPVSSAPSYPVSSAASYPVSSGPVAYPVTSLPPADGPRRSRPAHEAPARERAEPGGYRTRHAAPTYASPKPAYDPGDIGGGGSGSSYPSPSTPSQRSYGESAHPRSAPPSYGGSYQSGAYPMQGSSSYQGSGSYPLSGAYPTVSEPARSSYPASGAYPTVSEPARSSYPASGAYPTVSEPAQPAYPAPWGVDAPTPQRPSWDTRTGARARFSR